MLSDVISIVCRLLVVGKSVACIEKAAMLFFDAACQLMSACLPSDTVKERLYVQFGVNCAK